LLAAREPIRHVQRLPGGHAHRRASQHRVAWQAEDYADVPIDEAVCQDIRCCSFHIVRGGASEAVEARLLHFPRFNLEAG
jgi:hypothetical protein